MSTELECLNSNSDVLDVSNSSRVGNDEMSETLADPSSGQDQKLDKDEEQGCVTVEPGNGSVASAGDNGIEKTNGFTESVNGELDLGIGTQNVVVETNEKEKKVPVDLQEVMTVKADEDSLEVQSELLVEKDAEDEMVSSHGTSLSDVKGSDVEDINSHSSGKQGTESEEDFDVEDFMGLKPHRSKEESVLDDEPVTANLFSDSDLVWAKVRSHPWWPGQVFDSSAATDKAKKYSKKGSFLVTYFGDCTFAWNDASRLKPFRQHFSQMAKQSSLPDFLDAIDFALEEVSRRIEFGLACSCIPKEVYQKIKTQEIINPGIREESSRIHGGDKVSSAVSFEPTNLVEYVKRLAYSPNYDATEELEFVSQRAKLLAFNRWKGYTELPEFETLLGSVESAPKITTAEEKSSLLPEVIVPEKTKQVYTKRRKTEEKDNNCKQVFEYEDTTVTKKKEKTLAEFIAETRLNRNKSVKKSGNKEKKRKVVNVELTKSTKKTKLDLKKEDPESPVSAKKVLPAGGTVTPQKVRSSFGIGASILRVASQMHSSTPTGLIPCSNSTSKMVAKNNGSRKGLKEKPKAEALSGELEQVVKKSPSTNLTEDSVLEKDSSKEQRLHEDDKEADEVTINESNLVGSESSKEDVVSAE